MGNEFDELDVFYSTISNGTTVSDFLRRYSAIIPFIHSAGMTKDFRLKRSRVKKLSDEIAPTARFARAHAKPEDRIRFSFSDRIPDCLLEHSDGRLRQIEVTIAQAKERLNTMLELNEHGIGRGYLGLPDDRPERDFSEAMQKERMAYSPENVRRTSLRAIELCAQQKMAAFGDTLLIDFPFQPIPAQRWRSFTTEFREAIGDLRFSEVYLCGWCAGDDLVLRIK